jgi:hypothetical protein
MVPRVGRPRALPAGCYAALWVVAVSPTAEAKTPKPDEKPVRAANRASPEGAKEDIRLRPMFVKPVPQLKGQMEETIGEALSMPAPELLRRQRVSPASIVRQREDATAWVRRILKPAWVDEANLDNWLAIRAALQGNDALFGGWVSHGQPLQIVATAERIHVRVPMPAQPKVTAGLDLIRQAAMPARQLFNANVDWEKLPWQVRELGGFTVGYLDTPFVRDWWESCLIVSDGTAVKFSFLRIPHRDSPPAGESARQKPRPWFQ